jgi:hypothetical protein
MYPRDYQIEPLRGDATNGGAIMTISLVEKPSHFHHFPLVERDPMHESQVLGTGPIFSLAGASTKRAVG